NYRPDSREDNNDRYLANFWTYFLVSDGFDPASITPISANLFTTIIAQAFGSVAENVGELSLTHHLQNLGDIHFSPALLGDESSGNVINLYIFTAVVVALLFSGCINYVNLATARAANRTREVATRKLLGAEGRQLIGQFIGESMVFAGLGFVCALLLAGLVMQLGIVEVFTGKSELGSLLLQPGRIPINILAWLLLGLLTGIYPAIKLAQPSMLVVMSPRSSPGRRGLPLRELLVWLQMAVAMTIMACVFIMLRQSDYLLEAPLGFEKRNRLVVQLRGADVIRNRGAVMRELAQHPSVTSVTETTGVIGRNLSVSVQRVEQDNGEAITFTYNSFNGGQDYLQTMGIEVIRGDSDRLFQS
ncbi:MAG: FtsX-like permease family protein, partial [Gammaproteobacteria bacterium]